MMRVKIKEKRFVMMKKLISLLLAALCILMLAACAGKPNEAEKPVETATEAPKAEATEAPVETATEAPTEEPTEEPTAEPTEEPTPEPTEEPTPEPTEEPTPEPTEEPTPEPTEAPTEASAEEATEPAAEPTETTEATEPAAEPTETTEVTAPEESTLYVDFEDMSFWINGTKFTLGVSTLQDMIDAGVPFRADDLEDAGNNLKKNYQSSGFRIELGDYWTAQVYVLNDSDEGKKMSECCINEIYLPNKPDQTQDILKFKFPTNMTKEELVANSGMPEDEPHHYEGDNGYYSDTYEYKKSATKYLGYSKYSFEFIKDALNYITITYMP